MRLLLIGDSRDVAGILFDFFEAHGFELDYAADGIQGLSLGISGQYDVILLDVMMPGMDGYSVCRQLRESGVSIPILMLTARDTNDDTLLGFEQGADDYVVKPFDLTILEARVRALIRRSRPGEFQTRLSFGPLTLDLKKHVAEREGFKVVLNPTCFKILRLLVSKAPETVTRAEIIYELWQDFPPEGDVLRNHIYQLRNQIDKPFVFNILTTVPKIGYRLQAFA